MKEIISLHIGQAGNQIGFAIWELLCAEHGIDRDGVNFDSRGSEDRSFETFFNVTRAGKSVPRGLFIDLEPTVISQLRKGAYSQLYHPDQLISGNDDSAGNFSRAYYTVGRLLYGQIENKFRKEAEACDSIQTIILHRSLAGGAGSGLTSMIFEILVEYSKISRLEYPIHPAPHFDSCVVGPYNSILAEHFCIEECDIGLLLDNEALFDICTNILDVTQPTMSTINRILAQINSSLTSATRFHNDLFNDLTVFLTNLVPYPRIHFPLVSFAPLGTLQKLNHETNTCTMLTRAVFEKCNQLVKCDPTNGKYMSCSLVYRGLVSPCEVYSTLGEIKNTPRYKFVDWCPTGFKIGIVDEPPMMLPESPLGTSKVNLVMLTNSSAVSVIWHRLSQKFHKLYSKRSFVHWFVGEGLEETEFAEALFNLASLAKDYEEVCLDTKMLKTAKNEKTDENPKLVGEICEDALSIVSINETKSYDESGEEDLTEHSQNTNTSHNVTVRNTHNKWSILNNNNRRGDGNEIKQNIFATTSTENKEFFKRRNVYKELGKNSYNRKRDEFPVTTLNKKTSAPSVSSKYLNYFPSKMNVSINESISELSSKHKQNNRTLKPTFPKIPQDIRFDDSSTSSVSSKYQNDFQSKMNVSINESISELSSKHKPNNRTLKSTLPKSLQDVRFDDSSEEDESLLRTLIDFTSYLY